MLRTLLGPSTLSVMDDLGGSPLAKGFYLAGGTGLALHLGHRRSLGLDLFQRRPDPVLPLENLVGQLERLFGRERVVLQTSETTEVTFEVGQPHLVQTTPGARDAPWHTRVTLLAYPFRLIEPLVSVSELVAGADDRPLGLLEVARVRDIAAMKAYALGRRATYRDYVDLYFVLTRGLVSLETLIQDASARFVLNGEPLFSPRLFLQQLTFADDIQDKAAALDLVRQPQGSQWTAQGTAGAASELEDFLRGEVARYLRRWAASHAGRSEPDGPDAAGGGRA